MYIFTLRKSTIPCCILALTIFNFLAQSVSGRVIYVDDDSNGANNGSSWADAYEFLQDALGNAKSGDEIRVAQGIYSPDEYMIYTNGTGDRTATFQLVNGVAINGGYAGFGEPDPDVRDIELYETILSGNLKDGNSYHVVTGSGTDVTAVLDGFTIEGGNAGTDDGGGMYNDYGSPKVVNCSFVGNYADDGGGMCNNNSSPTLINCVFHDNQADQFGYGGGMYNYNNSSPFLDNCIFSNNKAFLGGGIVNSYSSLTMTNCWFDKNSAFVVAGLANYESSVLRATNCRFTANISDADGGALGNLSSDAVVINCIFVKNNAVFSGGSVYNEDGSATLTNCTIVANTAGRDTGGGVMNNSSSHVSYITLTNCILWDNIASGNKSSTAQISADPEYADINYCCVQDLSPNLIGSNNIASDPMFVRNPGGSGSNGGDQNNSYGDLRLSQASPCLDSGSNTADTDAYTPGLQSLPSTDFAGNPRFVGIVDMGALEGAVDTILVSPNPVTVPENGTATFTVALSSELSEPVTIVVSRNGGDEDISVAYGSTLTFNPSNFSMPQTVGLVAADDLDFEDGSATILLDGGAVGQQFVTAIEDDDDSYEPPKPPPPASDVIYVDCEASGINNGSSWSDAYKYLKDALYYAQSGDEVRVAEGIYRPDEDTGHPNGTGDREATFHLKNGVALKGGYAGFGEPDPDERNVEIYKTILSGDLGENDDLDFENNDENSHHVVTGSGTDSTAILDGFNITAGKAKGYDGGGMYNNNGSPKVNNCVFFANHADTGGGICNYNNSNPTVNDCIFKGNQAIWFGGGMYNDNSSPSLNNCIFRNNKANLVGGGIYNLSSYLNITQCWFDKNRASIGGGLLNSGSSPMIASCMFTANVSSADAGALGNVESNAYITNSIFIGNKASFSGGAVYNADGSANLTNCTIVANTAGRDAGGIMNDSSEYDSKLVLTNCILWGNMVSGKTGSSVQVSTNPDDSDINYCCIQNLSEDFDGAGNFDADPNLTPDGHLRVGLFSPCIGTGTPMNAPQVDWEGDVRLQANPRFAARGVDIGCDQFFDTDYDGLPDYWEQKYFGDITQADPNNDIDGDGLTNLEEYEFYSSNPVGSPLYIDISNVDDPINDGTMVHPFATIQAGIDAAGNGDTVLVAEGTYTGPGNKDINFGGKSLVLKAMHGPEVTIIDCRNSGRGFYFHSGEGPGTALVGLTITNGIAGYGGAIRCDNSHPQVRDCVLLNNSAYNGAGGIDCEMSILVLADCIFNNNMPAAIDMESGGARINGDLHIDSNCVGNGLELTGDGTLYMDSGVILNLNNSNVSCNIYGSGTIKVDPGYELIIKSDAIVDLGHQTDPNMNGRIICDGLLQLRDNASLLYAYVNVSRTNFSDNTIIANCVINAEAGAPYGQFFIEDNVSIWLDRIEADGDRYLDFNPEDFNDIGNIHIDAIEINITEGVGGDYGGLFELRGASDFVMNPSCDQDNEFFCQVDGIQDFNTYTWALDKLELVEGAKLNLTNRFDFQAPYNSGGDDEVLYVKNLILGPSSILNTAFNHLYYENLVMDPTAQVVNVPLLGFSLNNIRFDDENDFITRVKHNNFENPEHPDYDRIHVERITGREPDLHGMMRMCNLTEKDPNSPRYRELINARAKGLFAKANEDQILVQFEYLFETSEVGTELVIYLSDIPEFGDPNGSNYIEVGRIQAPPPGRPGSAGSGRFGLFKKTISAGYLDFIRGVRIELELIGPEGACVLINNWDPQVNCFGICMDFNWDNYVDTTDLMMIIRDYGLPGDEPGNDCLNSGFSDDGYIDIYDVSGWDWTLNLDSRLNFCGDIPLSNEASLQDMGKLRHTGGKTRLMALSSNPRGLLIMGKRNGVKNNILATKLEDRLYILDQQGQFLEESELTANRGNTKLVIDPNGDLYQLNYEEGLIKIKLIGGESVLPSGRLSYYQEPRYEMSATVSIGLQGDEDDIWGRPVMDAAFDADGFLYVVPVVVHPVGEEAYLAAAKLQLQDDRMPPYNIIGLYDDPPLPGDNQQRNSLREIEVDNKGNVYVTNSNHLNESDILWIFDSTTGVIKDRLDLVAPYSDVNIPAPTALCASKYDSLLYLASSINKPDAGSDIVYCLSTDTLSPVKIITIEGMGHITDITENPATGSIWVAGFSMSDVPYYPSPFKPSFYHPYLAEIPYGSDGPVQAGSLSTASDLELPMSILWAGSLTKGVGVAFNSERNQNDIDMVAITGLLQSWLEPERYPPRYLHD